MTKIVGEPHGRRLKKHPFGWLKNGNPPCNLLSLPRCQAKAKSTRLQCRNAAMKEKSVCWIHGGKSTGPRTPEGLERSKRANLKHGYYSAESIAARKYLRQLLQVSRTTARKIGEANETVTIRIHATMS